MNLNNYRYVNTTKVTGDIVFDVTSFLLRNNKQKTLKHVIDVANTNSEIAEMYGLDKDTCIACGYLHDISAVITPNDMLTYMIENNLFIDESEIKYPFILHQRISRLISKDFFNIDDVKNGDVMIDGYIESMIYGGKVKVKRKKKILKMIFNR